jgi:hypothetical protein
VSYATAHPLLAMDAKAPRVPRVNAATCVCGGRFFQAGGQPADSDGKVGGFFDGAPPRQYLGLLEEYEPHTRAWVQRAPMGVVRSHLALACVRGAQLVAAGGYGRLGAAPYNYEGFLDATEVYDLAADSWRRVGGMKTARYYLSATSTPAGLVYALGGFGSPFGVSQARA